MLKSATEAELAKTLGVLGNRDAIKILRFARNGFDASSDAHKKLGLSVKRYYYRLDKLVESGLIIRENERYELTPLGEIVYDSMERKVLWAIENIDQLHLMETLKRSKGIDDETLKKVATILGDVKPSLVHVIQTYEKLVDATIELTERAVNKFYLATRFSDTRCVEAGWRALRRGVEIRLISSDLGKFGRMKVLREMIAHPTWIKALYELYHSDKCQIRYGEVPFSFMVVDDRACCFEVLNPMISNFFAAVRIDDERISKKLMDSFNALWTGGSQDPMVGLSEDLMRGSKSDGS